MKVNNSTHLHASFCQIDSHGQLLSAINRIHVFVKNRGCVLCRDCQDPTGTFSQTTTHHRVLSVQSRSVATGVNVDFSLPKTKAPGQYDRMWENYQEEKQVQKLFCAKKVPMLPTGAGGTFVFN